LAEIWTNIAAGLKAKSVNFLKKTQSEDTAGLVGFVVNLVHGTQFWRIYGTSNTSRVLGLKA
jgi:hypothetical protein